MTEEFPEVIEPEIILSDEQLKDFGEKEKQQYKRAFKELRRPLIGRVAALIFFLFLVPITIFVGFFALASTLLTGVTLGTNQNLNRQTRGSWRAVVGFFGFTLISVLAIISPVLGVHAAALWLVWFMGGGAKSQ